MAVIDAHAHIYPEKIVEKATQSIGDFYLLPMQEMGRPDRLLEIAQKSPVTHFIVHSVATSPHAVTSINDFVSAECAEHPEFIGFAAMHQDFADKEAEVERAISLGLHGFKLHPDTQKVNIDDPRLMEFYEIIEGRLPVVIHTGDYRYTYSHPKRLRRVLDAFPNLVVDAAHFGGWSIFDQGWDYLHDAPNPERLFIDTSSSLPFLRLRRGKELIEMWGIERVMFGSDFPLWDPESEYADFSQLPFTDDEMELLTWRNAERFAGISVS